MSFSASIDGNDDDYGEVTVTILGSGTCVPSLTRSSCSVLISMDERRLLLDVGRGTVGRLLEIGTTVFDISHIFISHLHPDHTGELISFLFSKKYGGQPGQMSPLTLIAGRGFSSFYRELAGAYRRWVSFGPGMLRIRELDTAAADSLELGRVTVESLPMEHSSESLAYRIGFPGNRSVVYSGDTDVNDNLIRIAQDADLLICESSYPDGLKKDGHLTPSLAGYVAARANVGKLILTHLYPECGTVDLVHECRRTYDGPLLIAEDLMRITL